MEQRLQAVEQEVRDVTARVAKLENEQASERRIAKILGQQADERADRIERSVSALGDRVDARFKSFSERIGELVRFKEGASVKMGLLWMLLGAAIAGALAKILG